MRRCYLWCWTEPQEDAQLTPTEPAARAAPEQPRAAIMAAPDAADAVRSDELLELILTSLDDDKA